MNIYGIDFDVTKVCHVKDGEIDDDFLNSIADEFWARGSSNFICTVPQLKMVSLYHVSAWRTINIASPMPPAAISSAYLYDSDCGYILIVSDDTYTRYLAST